MGFGRKGQDLIILLTSSYGSYTFKHSFHYFLFRPLWIVGLLYDMAISPPLYYYNFDVNRHIVKDSGKEFYCAICNSNYKYEYSLKRHVLRTHVNRSYIIHSDLVAFGKLRKFSQSKFFLRFNLILFHCKLSGFFILPL